jgi:hypothetical protein
MKAYLAQVNKYCTQNFPWPISSPISHHGFSLPVIPPAKDTDNSGTSPVHACTARSQPLLQALALLGKTPI